MLSEYGIGVSDDAQLGERSLSVYTVTRSEESERATAEALLGEVSMTDRGGGIMYYSSPMGEMTFRATGGVDLQYYGITAPKSDDPEKTALEMAKKLGVTVRNSEDSVSVSVKEDDSTVVEVCCSFMGAQVVNCRLSFTFKYGKLLSLSGTRPLSEVTSESMTNVIDVFYRADAGKRPCLQRAGAVGALLFAEFIGLRRRQPESGVAHFNGHGRLLYQCSNRERGVGQLMRLNNWQPCVKMTC